MNERDKAIIAGQKFYESKRPCKNGHRERYTSNGMCRQCTIDTSAAIQKGRTERRDAANKARFAGMTLCQVFVPLMYQAHVTNYAEFINRATPEQLGQVVALINMLWDYLPRAEQ